MLGLFSIIAIGFFLGMRHATDPDHVIAVTTIVSQQRSLKRAALIGIYWGIGHTLTIFLVGCAIILFNIVIPIRLGLAMELSVGVMLILLGGWNLAAFTRDLPTHTHSHTHGEGEHSHDDDSLGGMDRRLRHSKLYQSLRPLLIGIVHGLAGSAAVALLILVTIRNTHWAIAYLLVFGVGTIAGMTVITMSIASAFHFVGQRFQAFGRRLALISGVISVGFGLLLAYQICVTQGLLSSHPHWTPR